MGQDTIIERKTFPEGGVIFKQDSTGRCAYIVQKGEVEIIKVDKEGGEKVLANIPKGAIFGEMALIDDSPRMAMARALEPTTVIIITERMFKHKLDGTDPFIRGLLGILSDTIRRTSK